MFIGRRDALPRVHTAGTPRPDALGARPYRAEFSNQRKELAISSDTSLTTFVFCPTDEATSFLRCCSNNAASMGSWTERFSKLESRNEFASSKELMPSLAGAISGA